MTARFHFDDTITKKPQETIKKLKTPKKSKIYRKTRKKPA
jgi:hypothetical protein